MMRRRLLVDMVRGSLLIRKVDLRDGKECGFFGWTLERVLKRGLPLPCLSREARRKWPFLLSIFVCRRDRERVAAKVDCRFKAVKFNNNRGILIISLCCLFNFAQITVLDSVLYFKYESLLAWNTECHYLDDLSGAEKREVLEIHFD